MFGLLKKKTSADMLARTIAAHALNPGACMQMAAMMRGYRVDDEVLIAEISLLRASFVRGLFKQHCSGKVYRKMADATVAAALESFKGQPGMQSASLREFYGNRPLTEIATARLEEYEAKGDAPALTSPIFCTRVRAPSIVSNIEVQSMLNDFLGAHVSKALGAVRAV